MLEQTSSWWNSALHVLHVPLLNDRRALHIDAEDVLFESADTLQSEDNASSVIDSFHLQVSIQSEPSLGSAFLSRVSFDRQGRIACIRADFSGHEEYSLCRPFARTACRCSIDRRKPCLGTISLHRRHCQRVLLCRVR
jgi:hypothetical protein